MAITPTTEQVETDSSAANEGLSREDFLSRFAGPQSDETSEEESGEESNEQSAIEALAQSEEEESSEDDNAAGEKPGQKAAPSSLKELAERLGVESKELYNIKVPMSNGDEKSLGEMKDAVQAVSDLETRQLEFEETKTEQENELTRAKQELRTLMNSLPKESLSQEKLREAKQQTEAWRDKEAERALEVIPDWKSEDKRAEERKEIIKHLEQYGFGASHFDGLIDHKMLKYVRDNWLREKRVKEALARAKEKQPGKTPGASRPSRRPARTPKAGPDSSTDSKVSAIADLLKQEQ